MSDDIVISDAIRLDACPFCGGGAILQVRRFGMEGFDRFAAGCPECAMWFGWYETPEEAAERWNRRCPGQVIERADD